MTFLRSLFVMGSVLTASAVPLLAPAASAFTIQRNNNPSDLLDILLGDTTGLSNIQIQARGDSTAFGIFSDDPFGLGAGIVLSTGRVNQLSGVNQKRNEFQDGVDLNTTLPGYDQPLAGLFDITQLIISFDVDTIVDQLFFEYVFGSEEFPEYAGSPFNDFFSLELNGRNLALLNDSVGRNQRVSINNLAASPNGPFSRDYINNPKGSPSTRLDGYTRTLTFRGGLQANQRNVLRILIADVADQRLDSAVFIKAQTLGTVLPGTEVPPPPEPEPEIPPTPEPEPEPEVPPQPPTPPVTEQPPQSIPEPGLLGGLLLFGWCGWRQRLHAQDGSR